MMFVVGYISLPPITGLLMPASAEPFRGERARTAWSICILSALNFAAFALSTEMSRMRMCGKEQQSDPIQAVSRLNSVGRRTYRTSFAAHTSHLLMVVCP